MFGDAGQARTNAAMLLLMIATTSSRTLQQYQCCAFAFLSAFCIDNFLCDVFTMIFISCHTHIDCLKLKKMFCNFNFVCTMNCQTKNVRCITLIFISDIIDIIDANWIPFFPKYFVYFFIQLFLLACHKQL